MSDTVNEIDNLLADLREQAIERAAELDPEFKDKVEADRKETAEHQKRLDADHAKKQEQARTEWHDLQDKMIETKRP